MGTPNAAHGASVKIGDAASPEVFTAIAQITSGPDGGGISPNMIEARVHSQEATIRRVTNVNYEPISFTVLYDSSDTQHALLKTSAAAGTLKNFTILGADTGAELMTFSAYIGINFSKNPDGWDEMSVNLEIDGAVAFT